MNQKLQDLQTRMNELQAEMKEEFSGVFTGETKALFEKYSWLKEISWVQYTPYFNDGDSCEFHVNEDFLINGCATYSYKCFSISPETHYAVLCDDEDEAEMFANEVEADEKLTAEFKEVRKVAEELLDFLGSNHEIALTMFEDHSKVSIQSDGVYVEEYDHD